MRLMWLGRSGQRSGRWEASSCSRTLPHAFGTHLNAGSCSITAGPTWWRPCEMVTSQRESPGGCMRSPNTAGTSGIPAARWQGSQATGELQQLLELLKVMWEQSTTSTKRAQRKEAPPDPKEGGGCLFSPAPMSAPGGRCECGSTCYALVVYSCIHSSTDHRKTSIQTMHSRSVRRLVRSADVQLPRRCLKHLWEVYFQPPDQLSVWLKEQPPAA